MDLASWAGGVGIEQVPVPSSLLPRGQVQLRDSFYSAPGYREIGMFYSCVPDPAYPWDPKVMREIRKYAPDATPLWVQWVFMSPQETGNPKQVVFGRHAIGRVIQNQRGYLEPFRVLMPTMPCQGLTFDRPNDIWFIHQGPMGQHPKYKDLPGDYLPFDMDLVKKVADISAGFRMTEAEYREHLADVMIHQVVKRELTRWLHERAEKAYARKHVDAYADQQYAKVSENEARDFYLGRGVRERLKKPTVVMGSTPKELK